MKGGSRVGWAKRSVPTSPRPLFNATRQKKLTLFNVEKFLQLMRGHGATRLCPPYTCYDAVRAVHALPSPHGAQRNAGTIVKPKPLIPDFAEFTFGRAFGATRWLHPATLALPPPKLHNDQ
jgi:hypothetical protein